MNNSLCLRQANVCSSTSGAVNSSQHALSGKCLSSSAPVRLSRLDRFNRNRPSPKCKAVRYLNGSGNEVLGTRVLARREHFGRGLGLGRTGRNGSMWSAGTWLDNKYELLVFCFIQFLVFTVLYLHLVSRIRL